MTPQEFKAWFDGFTEALDGTPNKAQWSRIKARVAEIDGKTVTERVYVDRYWGVTGQPRYYPWAYPVMNSASGGTGQLYPSSQYIAANMLVNAASGGGFNSLSAMNELGRAEAADMGVS